MTRIRALARPAGVALAALVAAAALAACESRATPAQIRSEARSQSTLSTGPTGAAAPGQATPVAARTPARPVDRRRGRRLRPSTRRQAGVGRRSPGRRRRDAGLAPDWRDAHDRPVAGGAGGGGTGPIGGVARTAVSNAVSRRRADRWAAQGQALAADPARAAAQQAPAPGLAMPPPT
jgi:hypothetical protein